MGERSVAAAIKPIAPVIEVDWLAGAVRLDERHLVRSDADAAACAVALGLARELRAEPQVVTVSGPGAVPVLEAAVAEGFARATRVVATEDDVELARPEDQFESAVVAELLASQLGGATVVVCGEASGDRGSASVPSRLAELLGWPQALGLCGVEARAGDLLAHRRLDGGRIEHLSVSTPCVLSVLSQAGTPPRAGLRAVLAAGDVADLVALPVAATRGDVPGTTRGPWRPPPSAQPVSREPRAASRALQVTGSASTREPPEVVRAEPDEAASLILARLEAWGLR